MTIIEIKELYRQTNKYIDKEIEIAGWLRTVRSSKVFAFMEINDGSFFKGLQVVLGGDLKDFDRLSKLNIGSSLKIKGSLVESPAKGQDFELKASEVEVYQEAKEDYPLQKKRHSFEFLRTISHLRGRSNTFNAVFRLRSTLSFAIHKFFQEKNFSYVHTPRDQISLLKSYDLSSQTSGEA
jgi:asparaginyl-tRNA synthetase